MVKQKIILTLFLVSSLNLFSQSKLEFDNDAITKLIYQHTNEDSPGAAVGIMKDGKIIYEKYLGYANLEHQAKVNENTRFNIASNAKQFTALCILQLVEQEKINLEDDFRTYLPNLYKNIQDKITISNLITHTSGIRDYCDLLALQGESWWKQFIDNKDVIELLQDQQDLNFKPNTEYLYSNSNYIILTEIVKKVTDQDFSEFTKAMFEKFDMTNTSFLTHYGAVIPNRARPYGNWNGWRQEPTITDVHGDGALFTTLKDQLKWEKMIQSNEEQVISKKLKNISQSPIKNSFTKEYGYGLMFSTHQGIDYAFHDGVTSAYNATFLRFPAENISIVIMSNNRNVPANYLAWQIAYSIFGLETEKKVYPDNPDKIEKLTNVQDVTGIYKGKNDGSIIKITEKDGSLYREMYQRDPVKLINEKAGLFEYETIKGLKMNFTEIGQSKQKFTLYMSSQQPSTFHKISDLSMNNFDKNGLGGRFYNEETDTEIIIKFVEGNTYSLTKNGRERKAKLILADYLRMMNSYKIKVIRDQENNIIGLNVNNKRIQNVKFKKTNK